MASFTDKEENDAGSTARDKRTRIPVFFLLPEAVLQREDIPAAKGRETGIIVFFKLLSFSLLYSIFSLFLSFLAFGSA
jgi:hypothetical protein